MYVTSDNSHYSIVKDLFLILSTRCRNFNVQLRAEGRELNAQVSTNSEMLSLRFAIAKLVEVRGFEPLTPALQTRCSAS